MHLDEFGARYSPITECRLTRDPDAWARAKFSTVFFGRDKLVAGMKRYSPKPVHFPITAFGGAENDTAGRRRRAVLCSKMMVAFADGTTGLGGGASSTADPDAAARHVLRAGVEDPLLKDEVYLLIFKQLTDCVDGPQRGPVWSAYMELLGFCASTFPPTPELENWVLQWLREHLRADKDRLHKYVAALHSTKYGAVSRTVRAIPELRSEWETRQTSRYSLHDGESSGPSVSTSVTPT